MIIDTAVQLQNVTFPTDAKLLNRAREKPGWLTLRHRVVMREPYARVGKLTL